MCISALRRSSWRSHDLGEHQEVDSSSLSSKNQGHEWPHDARIPRYNKISQVCAQYIFRKANIFKKCIRYLYFAQRIRSYQPTPVMPHGWIPHADTAEKCNRGFTEGQSEVFEVDNLNIHCLVEVILIDLFSKQIKESCKEQRKWIGLLQAVLISGDKKDYCVSVWHLTFDLGILDPEFYSLSHLYL